ncbi:MAG: hypothetical protein HC840_01015 [Leptolyngbyaceae cyanobacterium RM2_2_4]|nr:hypothetical protein [Leptolyngbyaceae cyanobacterium RM2_2_4]
MFNLFDNGSKLKLKKIGQIGDGIFISTMKLGDLIKYMKDGTIVDYQNNRGDGKVNIGKVKKIANSFDVNKLGTITISQFRDGTYKKADGHHRTAAMLLKDSGEYGTPPLEESDLLKEVSVHIIPEEEFMNVYSGLNTANGHSSRAKILNKDLGVGSLVDSILQLQKIESSVQKKFYTAIARCVYAYIGSLGTPIKDLSYAEVSLDRKFVSEDASLSKEDFTVKVTKTQKEEIATAIDYVNTMFFEYKKQNNLSTKGKSVKLNQTARSITSSASFFGFLLWDKLSSREYITGLTPKNLAIRITEKDAQIDRSAKEILNSVSRDQVAEKIVAYINSKRRI